MTPKPSTMAKDVIRLLLLLAIVVMLAACGDDEEEATPTNTPEPAQVAAPEPTATPAPAPAQAQESEQASTAGAGGSGPASQILAEQRNGMYSEPPPMTIDPAKYYYATLKTEQGDIKVQLFADRAPQTVNNFVYLAQQGYYDNTSFHRVLEDFMAQAGDPTGTGSGGPGYEFADEIVPGLVFDRPGLFAMANRGPGTNGSQFFITFAATDWLNELHTIFGEVIEGADVLDALTRRDPQQADTPGDALYTIVIEESDASVLPTPTPSPPTPTPTATPTPFAPSSLESTDRPLAGLPPAERIDYFNTPPEMVIDTSKQYTATIVTDKGELTVQLFDDLAPTAVNNFVVLANLGFYDNTPVNQVNPTEALFFGSPDNDPRSHAGYLLEAETGVVVAPDVGSVAFLPAQQGPDGAILSSSSLVLVSLITPPADAAMSIPFFGQVAAGQDVLTQLATGDTIQSITIEASD